MTNTLDLPEDDEDRPESPEMKRERELFERYRRRFKEYPPDFGVSDSEWPAFLKQVEEALKTGQPITLELPPDAVA